MKFITSHKKVFGTVTVNDKGQVVIPAEARKEMGIEADSKLMVFGWECGKKKALFMVEASSFEDSLQGFWGRFFKGSN